MSFFSYFVDKINGSWEMSAMSVFMKYSAGRSQLSPRKKSYRKIYPGYALSQAAALQSSLRPCALAHTFLAAAVDRANTVHDILFV